MKRNIGSVQDDIPAKAAKRSCPYLSQIKEEVIDFDFEKACSVTLSKSNVYACLVCGAYFAGRSEGTPAMKHAFEADHNLFINLTNGAVYCLPDNYEVDNPLLSRVKEYLIPHFKEDDIKSLQNFEPSYSVLGSEFTPGVMGLNGLGRANGYTSVIQLLMRITPLRDAMLKLNLAEADRETLDKVVVTLTDLTKRMCHKGNFKGVASPLEFVTAINAATNNKLQPTPSTGVDPIPVLMYLLGPCKALRKAIKNSARKSVLDSHVLSGEVEVKTVNGATGKVTTETRPLTMVTLELPPPPVFKEGLGVGQTAKPLVVPIENLMQKFDGKTITPGVGEEGKIFAFKTLPDYLLVHVKRFTKGKFGEEKNPAIVTLPIKGLDLTPYTTAWAEYENASKSAHQKITEEDEDDIFKEIEEEISKPAVSAPPKVLFDVVGMISHSNLDSQTAAAKDGRAVKGGPTEGVFKTLVQHWKNVEGGGKEEQWWEIEDLRVRKIMPETVAITEGYVLLLEKRQ